ncbi:hypothetical protein H8R29_14495 [Priestia megaterium]|uniref:Immunity 28 family protein n=1 Tax=Priestia megaterium (strain ATCC 14581 / DSM 32 / CCUG 1817 / JCM 2506 / NBRC 15308 / NCIMB 9376 / NCTC 10342 / NRRL B-14308 / VKM B-512 / Ford 19) TaxID=1348623 RepID=A0A0B6AW42_PRIM2|nr:Imm48 family immunity protein [Priestia megaterium]AJI24099.1 immunity 28 family protein [Priestia megaterium NBRC 15308 = ATCC 14581]KFM97146.1 immunity 28 family protein [Priestia megaterium]KGJ84665.1 hypothetical protein BMT_07800 [Priestia megaterium NBRC 15308 = ATCC 14581]MDQ0805311.1 uncharacterized protein YecA (UPF0149 family) [Priestia megaterium]MDR4234359.1 hypothetical protein [Priestia megaterium]
MERNLAYYSEMKKVVNHFLEICQLTPENLDEQEKQVVSTFCFGMINGYSLKEKKDAVQIQGATINILIEVFSYSPSASAEFFDFLIECTDKSFHPTMNAIIHRGIQAYHQYKENRNQELKENIHNIIDIIKSGS